MSLHRMLAICMAVALSACGSKNETHEGADEHAQHAPQAVDEQAPADQSGASAVVQLAPTQGNTVTGSLSLSAEENGVRLSGVVQGLKPNGEFGFHIHEKGDCSAPDASSAGGHFNPHNAEHGNPESDARHAGDMFNLRSDDQGTAQVDVLARGVTLQTGEPTDVLGRAIVVHEGPDDYTSQPAGNSGARVACGVIAPNG
jgi:Cu-Zn family superoxide dismutase